MRTIFRLAAIFAFASSSSFALSSESHCFAENSAVAALKSERLMASYINNTDGQNVKSIVGVAASLGQPLAISVIATREELPLASRIQYLEIAASIEYAPALSQLVELVIQVTSPIPATEYQFQILRNSVRFESLYLSELQKLALKTKKKHHLIAAIFWSEVLRDQANNSIGSRQELANSKLLENSISKPQLNEVLTRAALFRCERKDFK